MLIGFVGCPSSGKTTTAAMTFADLKNMGISSEFVPEQARMYIAEKRLERGLADGAPVALTDDDQLSIILKQIRYERILVQSSGTGTTVVADSSALNTLLYMSAEMKASVSQMLTSHLPLYDLLFYCAPVKMLPSLDPNRIHNEEQALRIDAAIPSLLREFNVKPIFLTGDSRERHHVVTKTILETVTR